MPTSRDKMLSGRSAMLLEYRSRVELRRGECKGAVAGIISEDMERMRMEQWQMIDLGKIRSRNEERRSDPPCSCVGHSSECSPAIEEHEQAVADIDALVAEVEQLQSRLDRILNRCVKCNYVFLRRSNYDRHPCPPPPDYNFGAP
jgi:hypothetical protein